MAIEEGSDYTVEELDDSRIRLTIDGQPLDVYALDDATPARPSGRGLRLLVGAVALLAIAIGVFMNRAPLLAWAAVNAPRTVVAPATATTSTPCSGAPP